MELKDKVAIVTGASEGIGLAVAKLLSENGSKLVLVARSEQKLKEAAAEMPDALAVQADLHKPEDIKKIIDEAIKKYGRIDILINNAGKGIYGPVEEIDLTQYREIMELNVFAVVEAMKLVIPIMRRQGGGLIMNISSNVSKNYFPGIAAYTSTKYALNAISLTARKELAEDNIVVCVMHPRMTATRFGVNAFGGDPEDSRATGKAAPGVDTAEDVARKILEQIISEEAETGMNPLWHAQSLQ